MKLNTQSKSRISKVQVSKSYKIYKNNMGLPDFTSRIQKAPNLGSFSVKDSIFRVEGGGF